MKKMFLAVLLVAMGSVTTIARADWPNVYGWAFEGNSCTGLAYEVYSFREMLWQLTANGMQSYSLSFGEPQCFDTPKQAYETS